MTSHGARTVTVLRPVPPGRKTPGVQARCSGVPNAGLVPCRLTLQWDDGDRDDVVWTSALKDMIGTVDDQFTDGSLAHWHRDSSGVIQARAVFDATVTIP